MNADQTRLTWRILPPLAIFGWTLLLRLPMVGGPPFTDGGIYAYSATMAAHGAGSLQFAPLNLYASILSVAGSQSSAPLLRYRIVDGFMAAFASVMVFLFLRRWTSSAIALVMAAGWAVASNAPLFVDAGLKNPIAAANVLYVGALWLLSSRSSTAPFWAGLLIPLAVFMREAYLPVTLVTFYLAAVRHGRRGLVLHVAGVLTAGIALLVWMWLYRGSPRAVLGLYSDIGMFFRYLSATERDVPAERLSSMKEFVKATRWTFPVAVVGLGWLLSRGREKRVAKGLAVLLFVPPVPEIFGKLCIAYHWAQFLLGMAFLGAMGLQWLGSVLERVGNRAVAVGAYVLLAWLVGEIDGRSEFRAYREGFRLSREFAPVMIWGKWDDPAVERSAYLKAAKCIRECTAPGDRIVTSGFYLVLYPLSGRFPPSPFSADLTTMSGMEYPRRRPELIEQLRRHPPALVIESLRFPVKLHDFWPDFERRYRVVTTIPIEAATHYGGHGSRIWAREAPGESDAG